MTPGPSSGSHEQRSATRRPGRRHVKWTRGRKAAFGAIGFGSIIIATVGFVGSYDAVRRLAEEKGFGWFAQVFPLGIDVGIAVLLSLDLALTWVNLKWAPLRYIAWVLTGATVVFNAAASWPDLLASTMHGVIPLLFIAVVEAVRNAIAKATAMEDDQHMDSIRLSRWFLSPVKTFLLWRRMKLWELRSYQQVINLEQDRMVYQAQLEARFGRRWRRKAPVAALMPLRLSEYGVPLAETAPVGLAAAGIEPILLPTQRPAESPGLDPGPQQPGLADPAVPVPELAPAANAPGVPRQNEVIEPAPPAREKVGRPGAEQLADTDEAEEVARRGEADVPEDDGEDAGQHVDTEDGEMAEPGQDSEDVPALDLGTAPPNESKAQKSERIYIAHQKAGVELTRANLAKWAGYVRDGSGRTQYARLEEKHGPIEPKEGADQLDLDLQGHMR